MKLKIFVLILFVKLISTQSLSFENNLLLALKEVDLEISRYYSNKASNLIAVNNEKNDEVFDRLNMKLIIELTKKHAIKIYNDEKGLRVKDLRKYVFLLLNDHESFIKIEKYINGTNFKSSGCLLIVLLNGNVTDLHKIFDIMWNKKIYNTYGLIKGDENNLEYFTMEPFEDPVKCGDTKPKLINKFINGSFIRKFSILPKFQNLNLCVIKIATFHENVAVFKEVEPDGTEVYRGHEIQMIQTVAKALNFTIEFDYYDGGNPFETVFENGTATGVLKKTQSGEIDIAMGDYYLKSSRIKMLDMSESYLSYPLVFLINRGRKLTALEKMLQPFSKIVWILLFATFFFAVLVIFVINYKFKRFKSIVYGEKISSPVMNMLIIIFGSQQPKLPKKNFARFILMMFIILCFVMRGIYQGSLFKFLQSDGRHKEPQSIDELVEHQYTVLVHSVNNDILMAHPLLKSRIDNKAVRRSIDFMMEISDKIAVIATEVVFIDYSKTHRTFPYKIINENFESMNIVMYYRKDYFLRESIDRKLQAIIASGLLKFWLREFDHRDEWKSVDINPVVLTFDHLIGAFTLMIIGHFLALLAFFIELFMEKWEKFEYII